MTSTCTRSLGSLARSNFGAGGTWLKRSFKLLAESARRWMATSLMRPLNELPACAPIEEPIHSSSSSTTGGASDLPPMSQVPLTSMPSM